MNTPKTTSTPRPTKKPPLMLLPPLADDSSEAGDLLAIDEPSIPDDERLRTEVWNGLVHCLVSNAALWETVDVGEVKVAMTNALRALPRRPLSLQPLWDLMIARGTPFEAAMDTSLFFASRADRWGIEIALPTDADFVSPAERRERVARLQARGTSTGTYVGLPPGAGPNRARGFSGMLRRVSARRSTSRAIVARFARVAVILFVVVAAFGVIQQARHSDVPLIEASLSSACAPAVITNKAVVCWLTPAAQRNLERTQWLAQVTSAQFGVEVVLADERGEVLATAQTAADRNSGNP